MARRALATLALAVLALTATACKTEQATCRRMKDLCGTSDESCRDLLQSTRDTLGEKGVETLGACFEGAKTCAEASGCVAGAGLKGLTESAGEFLEGMKKALEKK